MASVTLKGNPVPVAGQLPQKGETGSDFRLVGKDLQNVALSQFAGKRTPFRLARKHAHRSLRYAGKDHE